MSKLHAILTVEGQKKKIQKSADIGDVHGQKAVEFMHQTLASWLTLGYVQEVVEGKPQDIIVVPARRIVAIRAWIEETSIILGKVPLPS